MIKNARHQTAVLIIYYKYKKFFVVYGQFDEFFLIFLKATQTATKKLLSQNCKNGFFAPKTRFFLELLSYSVFASLPLYACKNIFLFYSLYMRIVNI